MATFNSGAVDNGMKIDRRKAGSLLCRSAKYTAAGAKAAGSVLAMVPMPAGARIVAIGWKCSALGAARTLALGDGTTANKYLAATSVASAASGMAVVDDKLAADANISATIAGDTFIDTAVLSVHVFYKMADSIADEV